ncbi:MAG: type I DNA topoisomerase [Candidatus Pacebacteria bacterium]|nr:type I DNA topoisomerase [Candidatus Paceibacterota bacterium]
MNLVIVESPTKAKTISKFLGRGYKIMSSFGHVRDLPEDKLGIDIENNFKPEYVIPSKSKKVISSLKKESKKSERVILATDEDREGESISWHLEQILNLRNPQRIAFHEITKPAIEEALSNPRKIDMNLVNAQQARRILDRIVGYKLSPFLWKKVARRLSAGRVQSVAVRLIVEREREIEKFIQEQYWTITALLSKDQKEFEALLFKKDKKVIPKMGIKTEKQADEIIKELKDSEYMVEKVEKKETKKNPLPPFTTSTLQQEASKRLRFPAKMTMSIAQRLYEKGLITYHRTDSLNLSNQSLFTVKKFIEERYGKNYWPGFFKKYKAKGKVQEAHEAIRPAHIERTPDKIKEDKNSQRLYELIWRRFTACQMAPAVFDSQSYDIKAKNYAFRATGQTLKFEGFLKVYQMSFEEKDLPALRKGDILNIIKLSPLKHLTQPPPRYNEASLIKALEENGIGRPSTYAPIISTIQDRNYIEKDKDKRFSPTEIGTVVNDLLVEHFPEIVDVKFTAEMEQDLDKIAQAEKDWVKICRDFYAPFEKNLKKKYKEVSKKDITEKPTEKICPKCGSPLVERLGKFGRFYACSAFPKCRYTESLKENILGIKCPKCIKGEILEKRTKRGKLFYGCSRFPKCDFALWDKPTGKKCPICDSLLTETKRKQVKCSNKDCQYNKKMAK